LADGELQAACQMAETLAAMIVATAQQLGPQYVAVYLAAIIVATILPLNLIGTKLSTGNYDRD